MCAPAAGEGLVSEAAVAAAAAAAAAARGHRYNDMSPMENHHISAAFKLMRQKEYNFIKKIPRDKWVRAGGRQWLGARAGASLPWTHPLHGVATWIGLRGCITAMQRPMRRRSSNQGAAPNAGRASRWLAG